MSTKRLDVRGHLELGCLFIRGEELVVNRVTKLAPVDRQDHVSRADAGMLAGTSGVDGRDNSAARLPSPPYLSSLYLRLVEFNAFEKVARRADGL